MLQHLGTRKHSKYGFAHLDSELVRTLVCAVHKAVDDSVPPTVRRTDASHWKFWVIFCALVGTDPIRDDHAANSGADHEGHAQEVLLQNMFLVWRYGNMAPRRKSDPAAKPQSATKSLLAVKRAHKRRGINMPASTSTSLVIKGLLNEYVRVHGPESLLPHQKAPLTNPMMYDIAALADGTAAGRFVVQWTSRLFLVFWAFLCTLRHAGARKADFLPVTAAEFCGKDLSRAHFQFIINGELVSDPTPNQLRGMKVGDIVRARPPPSKADPWALTFGNAFIYLPFQDDRLNAAKNIVEMELAAPCRGAARRGEPAFNVEDGVSLDHKLAGDIFAAVALVALGAAIANTVSLHGGRVWLACALLARRKGDGVIQAMQRWKSPESIKIYAKMEPHEYVAHLLDALDATVTPQMVDELPPADMDEGMRRLSGRAERSSGAKRAAANSAPAPTAPRRIVTDAPAGTRSGSDTNTDADESDGDSDQGDVVTVTTPMAVKDVTVNTYVGVCFYDKRRTPTYYKGLVTKVMATTARVKFREFDDTFLNYDVKFSRIYTITPTATPDAGAPSSTLRQGPGVITGEASHPGPPLPVKCTICYLAFTGPDGGVAPASVNAASRKFECASCSVFDIRGRLRALPHTWITVCDECVCEFTPRGESPLRSYRCRMCDGQAWRELAPNAKSR